MKVYLPFFLCLLLLSACSKVKLSKLPLLEEKVVLDYFVDSIVPKDEHLKDFNFEFDFVLREGVGGIDDYAFGNAFMPEWLASHNSDSVHFLSSFGRSNYRAPESPLRIKNNKRWNFQKIKYDNDPFGQYSFYRNFCTIPLSRDTAELSRFTNKKGRLFLGADGTEQFGSNNIYKQLRLQVVYRHDDIIYDKSYYFVLMNQVIKRVGLSITTHDRKLEWKNITLKPLTF